MSRRDLTVKKNANGELEVHPEQLVLQEMPQGVYLLVWTLDPETLPDAEFAEEDIALQWKPPGPPYHVFRRGRVSADKRVLTILDRNQDSQTKGDFKYELKVVEPDLLGEDRQLAYRAGYQASDGRPITNPIIINR